MTNHYTNVNSVRKFTGLKISDGIEDSDLDQFLTDVDHDVMKDISIERIADVLTGNIDGVNVEYWIPSHPIADTNFDSTVNSLDVTVYKWGTSGSIDLREECTVSSLNPHEGRVILSSAPATTFDVITADYRFYPCVVDWTLIERAASYLAGFYYVTREMLLIPTRYRMGAITFTHVKPYKDLLELYYITINKLISRKHAVKTFDDISLDRKYMSEMP